MISEEVNLYKPQLRDFDKPLRCVINQRVVIPKKNNWESLFIGVVEHFIRERNPFLDTLDNLSVNSSDMFFFSDPANLISPWRLTNDKWIELHCSPNEIIATIRKLCFHCRVDLDKVKVYLVHNNTEIDTSKQKLRQSSIELSTINVVTPVSEDSQEPSISKKRQALLQKKASKQKNAKNVKNIHGKDVKKKVGQHSVSKKTTSRKKVTTNQEKIASISSLPTKPPRDSHGRFISKKRQALLQKKASKQKNAKNVKNIHGKDVKKKIGHHTMTKKITDDSQSSYISIDRVSCRSIGEKSKEHVPNTIVNPIHLEMIKYTLMTHFPKGFKIDSVIELTRFRRFMNQEFGNDIELTNDDLLFCFNSCGIIFEGKVFYLNPGIIEQIENEIKSIFNSGARVIFYESFYERHSEWLYQANIVSAEMLVSIIEQRYPSLNKKKNYFTQKSDNLTELENIEREILRVWGSDNVKTYNTLALELPYIPEEKIKLCLHVNTDFITNRNKEYTHLSRFSITTSELNEIESEVNQKMASCDYISLVDLAIPSSLLLRYHDLDQFTIQKIIAKTFLIEDFDVKGKILTKKGNSINVKAVMMNFCKDVERCSLSDLTKKEKELTGKKNGWYSLEAAYTVLVRIDKNTFVSDEYVDFNIDAIDNAISMFVKDEYLPLKAFTTFAEFPDCKQMWNLYLLESYCRRFSKNFRIETPSVNSRNAGIVIRVDSSLTYMEIMTMAVYNAGIPCENKAVIEYLYQNGYIGKKTTSKAPEITKKLKNLNERLV
jgi:hypothetical protein